MKASRRVRLGGAIIAGLLGATALAQPAAAQQFGVPAETRMALENHYIFVFTHEVLPGQAAARAEAMVAQEGGRVDRVYTGSIRGFAAYVSPQAAERMMARNPSIAYYEKDQPAFVFDHLPAAAGHNPSAKKGKPGGGGTQPPETVPWGIARVNGGVSGATGTAWVIDTGIDLDHPDLNVDVSRSVNFARGKNTPDDQNGHGSHVAGTIAAIDNDIGVIGVAAGATLVSVRVLDANGSGTFADVIAGVDYVGANGKPGDVANMSLGGGFSQALNDAVAAAADKGVKFAIAAGNESQNALNVSPASTEHPNVYTVSAIDSNDVFASFSNWGNPPIDCADPGVSVFSTYKDGGYATLSGTSMATPHLAGILLLGQPRTDGFAINDPDGNPDPICVH